MGDQGRNLFNLLYCWHPFTSLHSPATWFFSEQWRGLCCSDSTSYITLQLATMAVNTPNVHIIAASIQGITFLVKFLHRTRDGTRHGKQPAQSPTSQGVIFSRLKKAQRCTSPARTKLPLCKVSQTPTGKGHSFFPCAFQIELQIHHIQRINFIGEEKNWMWNVNMS